MFANNNLGCTNFAFPDVCKTPIPPAGPVPIPYPNIALSSTHVPSCTNIIIGGGMAENLMTEGTLSNGDQAGVAGGVVSGLMMGPDKYLMGSTKVFLGGAPAARLTSSTGQNGSSPNAMGTTITPAQTSVLLLG